MTAPFEGQENLALFEDETITLDSNFIYHYNILAYNDKGLINVTQSGWFDGLLFRAYPCPLAPAATGNVTAWSGAGQSRGT
jgi:hypothetical protein